MAAVRAANRPYASGTKVGKWKSLEAMEALVKRFGGSDFSHTENAERIALLFVAPGSDGGPRRVRYFVLLPDAESLCQGKGPGGRPRTLSDTEVRAALSAETDRIWRALLECIKGKFVGIESGIETFEETFWAHIMTPSGATIYEETREQIAHANLSGAMPELLPGMQRPQKTLEAKRY